MTIVIDNRANTRWENSDTSYKNYQSYIISKSERKFNLTMLDLLYISNFKGGNASIHEDEISVNKKLEQYSKMLIKIDERFGEKELIDLSVEDCDELIEVLTEACNLTKERETKIYGIGASYLSALLNAYFPNLIPILDRRVLINLKLVSKADIVKSTKQIKNIERFYEKLVEKSAKLCQEGKDKTLRDIDREYFIRVLDYDSLE